MAEKNMCGKASGFNFFATEIGDHTVLCKKCYSKIIKLKKTAKHINKEVLISKVMILLNIMVL